MAPQVVEVHADSAALPEVVWRLLADVTTWDLDRVGTV